MTGIDPAMFELFREEVRSHAATLARGLLDVEADPANPTRIEPLMRAAHSIKGACRIVGIDTGVRLAHVMEDALVAAQHGKIRLTPGDIDALLKGSDLLASLGELTPGTPRQSGGRPTRPRWRDSNPCSSPWPEAHRQPLPVLPLRTRRSRRHQLRRMPGSSFPPAPPFEPIAIPRKPLPLPPEHSMLDLFREELREHLLGCGGRGCRAGSGKSEADSRRGADCEVRTGRARRGRGLRVPLGGPRGAARHHLRRRMTGCDWPCPRSRERSRLMTRRSPRGWRVNSEKLGEIADVFNA